MGHGNSKFNQKIAERIFRLAEKGKTDAQISKIIGVSERTLRNWKGSQPDFLPALKESKGVADDMVEAALFSRAIGYSHIEEKVFMYKGEIVTHRTQKHYPPDPVAAIYWLNNRRPEDWSNKAYIQNLAANTQPTPEKKSFVDFVITAGYPRPYPKQLEMCSFGFDETEPRMLMGARGYGKTDYVTVLGTAYDIYINGVETSNLIISKSRNRNAAIVQEIANALEANGVRLDKNNSTCVRVEGMVGKDHSVEAITIKTSFRGRHPKRILMDDPVTEEDVSPATRELVKRKYDEAYKLCKNICIIGQPAHQFDLYAELKSALKVMEVPHGLIPELDADLEAMEIAGVDPRSIQMSYKLTVPKDGATPFDEIRFIDQFPQARNSVAFIDPASEGKDYTAISIVTGYMQGVAVVGFNWRKSWNHSLEEMIPYLKKFNVRKLCFETNSLGDQPIEILRNVFRKEIIGWDIGVVGRKSNNNKHSRILAAGTFAHMIHLSKESGKSYTDHVVKYEYKAPFDDAPDSMATCLEWMGMIRGKE